MYDVIRKSYCCAKSRLSRNFSYISRQGIMRPACRDSALRAVPVTAGLDGYTVVELGPVTSRYMTTSSRYDLD